MSTRRPLFAAVLLVLAVVGSGVMPAVHWVSHGLHASSASETTTDAGRTLASEATPAQASDVCPGCAHVQSMHATGPNAVPFYAAVVGLEQAVPPPADPALTHDVATPEGRGPPSRA